MTYLTHTNNKELKMEKKIEKQLNIFQKLNAVMADVKYVKKEDKKNGMQYRFVSHDAVAAALHEPLTKHGIVACPSMEYNPEYGYITVSVRFTNIANPEDFYSTSCIVPITKKDPKEFGSAYSYGYKFVLLKTFMLESGEQDVEEREPKQTAYLSSEQVQQIKSDLKGNEEALTKILGFYKAGSLDNVDARNFLAIKKFSEKWKKTANQKEEVKSA